MSLFDRLLQQAASPRLDRLLQYGVASPLAKKAEAAGLTTTMIRSLSQGVMVKKFGLEAPEAAELKKCVARQPTRTRSTCCWPAAINSVASARAKKATA